jgi:hypothetical protein
MFEEILNSKNLERLLQMVNESVRASREDIKFFFRTGSVHFIDGQK